MGYQIYKRLLKNIASSSQVDVPLCSAICNSTVLVRTTPLCIYVGHMQDMEDHFGSLYSVHRPGWQSPPECQAMFCISQHPENSRWANTYAHRIQSKHSLPAGLPRPHVLSPLPTQLQQAMSKASAAHHYNLQLAKFSAVFRHVGYQITEDIDVIRIHCIK